MSQCSRHLGMISYVPATLQWLLKINQCHKLSTTSDTSWVSLFIYTLRCAASIVSNAQSRSVRSEAEALISISMIASRLIIFSTFLLPLGAAWDLHACVEPKCNTSLSSPLSQVNCKCDNDCALYGDCCLDYTANSTSRPSALHGLLECQKVHTSGVLMVSRCPIQSELNIRCTNQSLFLPVTDPGSNFTFRNIYCALCNNVSREVVVPWQPHFFCGGEVNVSSIRTFESLENECRETEPVISSKTSILRTCIPHIHTCSSRVNVSANIVHNCTSGPYDVVTAGSVVASVFRNHYCAQCNGVDVDDIHCLTHFNLTSSPSNTTGIPLYGMCIMIVSWVPNYMMCSDKFLWIIFRALGI